METQELQKHLATAEQTRRRSDLQVRMLYRPRRSAFSTNERPNESEPRLGATSNCTQLP